MGRGRRNQQEYLQKERAALLSPKMSQVFSVKPEDLFLSLPLSSPVPATPLSFMVFSSNGDSSEILDPEKIIHSPNKYLLNMVQITETF